MSRTTITLDDRGWLLWCDTSAEWENDPLFLPNSFTLSDLPSNSPTIGWQQLEKMTARDSGVKQVTLPTTVEEHFWRELQERPYKPWEYAHAATDPQAVNGMYQGVSWWWQHIQLPEALAGKRLILSFRGARLRAEVYVNRQLVGYNIITETPFTVDITDAAQPGKDNLIAIRITNHGGRHDWIDAYDLPHTLAAPWGKFLIPVSHGFGGIDAGIELVATDDIWLEDVFFQNLASLGEAAVQVTICNQRDTVARATLHITITPEQAPGTTAWTHTANRVRLDPGENVMFYPISISDVIRWTLDYPHLYRMRITLLADHATDETSIRVGFRQFAVKGRGTNAHFFLNDRRIVLRSAISWSLWPNNGLFPTREFAQKQVDSALAIGLNMLNYHRNISNPAVLDIHDEQGLLALQEPGGGMFAWDHDDFARGYMLAKIERMIRRDRNHPALTIYVVMNELVSVPPSHPYMRQVLGLMRDLDPTRIIVNQSGLSDVDAANDMMKHLAGGVAYYLPHDSNYYHDDGSGYCGWWDQHTVSGPTVWIDDLYRNPQDYKHRSENQREIVLWGEATPSPASDDLAAIKAWYEADPSRTGFTRREHLDLYEAFDRYLTDKGFRGAFPTVEQLTRSAGNRAYDFWGRMLEQVRICDAVDGIVINGWETCFYENHSGIVDIFRNPKGDPERVRSSTHPLHLAVKSRAAVLQAGQPLVTDIYVVNERDLRGAARLTLRVIDPHQRLLSESVFEVVVSGGDVFGELLQADITHTCFQESGYYQLEARLEAGDHTVAGQETVFVVDWQSHSLSGNAVIVDRLGYLRTFAADRGVSLRDYHPTVAMPVIILAEASEIPDIPPAKSVVDYLEMLEQLPKLSHVHTTVSTDMMEQVAQGARLVLIADDSAVAERWMQQLHDIGVIHLEGMVGTPRMVWMGANFFAREHPVLADLPVNTVLSWEYQADMRGTMQSWEKVSASGANGACIEADHVEHIIGYTRDHDRNIGTALGIIHHGRGQIIFSMLPGLYSALFRPSSLHPQTARKLIVNLLRYALLVESEG